MHLEALVMDEKNTALNLSKDPTLATSERIGFAQDLKSLNLDLKEKIGGGAFGTVYAAKHHLMQVDVAVKFLHGRKQSDPNWKARFQREAHAMSRLDHPNIVKILSFSLTAGDDAIIVMELLSGKTIAQIIQEQGPFSVERAVHVCAQVADALQYAHENGIVHRDIKPENIMLTDDGIPKLLDFGIAKLETGAQHQKLTSTGQILGTPEYMSPEQCAGKPAEASSDSYSLTCVFYFLLFGRSPFQGATDAETMMKHISESPNFNQLKVSIDLRSILEKGLKKKSSERFSDCRDLATALRKASLEQVASNQYSRKENVKRLGITAACCALLLIVFLALKAYQSTSMKAVAASNQISLSHNLTMRESVDFESQIKEARALRTGNSEGQRHPKNIKKSRKLLESMLKKAKIYSAYQRWRILDQLCEVEFADRRWLDARNYATESLDSVLSPKFMSGSVPTSLCHARSLRDIARADLHLEHYTAAIKRVDEFNKLLTNAQFSGREQDMIKAEMLSLEATCYLKLAQFKKSIAVSKKALAFNEKIEGGPHDKQAALLYEARTLNGLMEGYLKFNALESAEHTKTKLLTLIQAEYGKGINKDEAGVLLRAINNVWASNGKAREAYAVNESFKKFLKTKNEYSSANEFEYINQVVLNAVHSTAFAPHLSEEQFGLAENSVIKDLTTACEQRDDDDIRRRFKDIRAIAELRIANKQTQKAVQLVEKGVSLIEFSKNNTLKLISMIGDVLINIGPNPNFESIYRKTENLFLKALKENSPASAIKHDKSFYDSYEDMRVFVRTCLGRKEECAFSLNCWRLMKRSSKTNSELLLRIRCTWEIVESSEAPGGRRLTQAEIRALTDEIFAAISMMDSSVKADVNEELTLDEAANITGYLNPEYRYTYLTRLGDILYSKNFFGSELVKFYWLRSWLADASRNSSSINNSMLDSKIALFNPKSGWERNGQLQGLISGSSVLFSSILNEKGRTVDAEKLFDRIYPVVRDGDFHPNSKFIMLEHKVDFQIAKLKSMGSLTAEKTAKIESGIVDEQSSEFLSILKSTSKSSDFNPPIYFSRALKKMTMLLILSKGKAEASSFLDESESLWKKKKVSSPLIDAEFGICRALR